MSAEVLVPVLLNALSTISILALIALGLAIVFGMMDVVNLAHAEFVTIGAYTVALVQKFGAPLLPAADLFWIGLLLAPLVGMAFGFLVEALVIRPLYRRTLDTLLATYALSLIFQKLLQMGFGTLPWLVTPPFDGMLQLGSVSYPQYRLFIIGMGMALVLATLLVFAKTRFGADLRAVIQNAEMAEAVGLNTRRLNGLAFAGGAGLAALAGALVAPMTSVQAHLGIFYIGKAFFVIVLGGVGSILGGVVGSAVIGSMETVLNYLVDPSFASAIVLLVAIVIIRFRPQGIVPGFSAAHHLLGKG